MKIGITKGRVEKQVLCILEKCGYNITPLQDKKRKLIVEIDDYQYIFARAKDIITYIEHGIVDIGFVGKDVMIEHSFKDYYELMDLEIGKCFFALAGFENYDDKKFSSNARKIATKYPNVTRAYFASRNEDVEIIKLEGSVELAPVLGMSEAIVDIVETGSTLKAHDLQIIEKIEDISIRLIANKVSFRFNHNEITKMVTTIKRNCKGDEDND